MFGSVGGGGGLIPKKTVNLEPKTNDLQAFLKFFQPIRQKNWEKNVLTLAYRSYKIN